MVILVRLVIWNEESRHRLFTKSMSEIDSGHTYNNETVHEYLLQILIISQETNIYISEVIVVSQQLFYVQN